MPSDDYDDLDERVRLLIEADQEEDRALREWEIAKEQAKEAKSEYLDAVRRRKAAGIEARKAYPLFDRSDDAVAGSVA